MGSQTIQVMIVDDHAMVRAGIKILLEQFEGIQVIGEAANGCQAIELVEQLDPDVILMDLHMPVMDGIEATRRILAIQPSQHIIVLTGMLDDERLFQAVHAGAQGCVEKTIQPEELVQIDPGCQFRESLPSARGSPGESCVASQARTNPRRRKIDSRNVRPRSCA